MEWLDIDAERLLHEHGPKIWVDPILNNRFIGLMGLVQRCPDPGKAWLLKDQSGLTRLLAVETSEELIPLTYSMFPLTPDVIQAIRSRFASPLMITLHDHQCAQWEEASTLLRCETKTILCSSLYALARGQLRSPSASPGGHGRRILAFDEGVGDMIAAFAMETLHRRMTREQSRRAFERNDFYGWYEDGLLLSIAAATRFSLNSRCISYVFTRAESRGRSIAARLLEEWVAQMLLAHEQVFLYADRRNPSSNRLYQKIGFRIVASSKTYSCG